jgi:AraC-like DNA-binding protein
MSSDLFFRDSRLSFVTCRYTHDSQKLFKPHLHRSFSVGAVKRGRIRYRIANHDITLQKGSLALINPDTLHSCNPVKSESRSFYMLYLEIDWCRDIQQSLWKNKIFVEVDCVVANDPDLYWLYLDTVKCLMSPTSHLMKKEQMVSILAEAIFARCCYPEVPDPLLPAEVAELKVWLSQNLEHDVTLEDYARQKGLNSYTLLKHFRLKYGVTPHAFRTNCRIEHGRKLLQEGVEIADAALLCGFFDQSHFHRHFKAMTSVTPYQYKTGFLSS